MDECDHDARATATAIPAVAQSPMSIRRAAAGASLEAGVQGRARRDASKAINPVTSQNLTERQQLKVAEQVTGVERLEGTPATARVSLTTTPRRTIAERERTRCRRRRGLEPLAEPHLLTEVRLDSCDVDIADGDMPVTGGPEADRPPQVVGAVR